MNTRKLSKKKVHKGSYKETEPDDFLISSRRPPRRNKFKGSYKESGAYQDFINTNKAEESYRSQNNVSDDTLKEAELDDDLSYASTSSTITGISSECCTTYDDSEGSYDVDDDDENDDDVIDKLQYKLEHLKVSYFETKVEHSILKRCTKAENVSNFLSDLFHKKKSKNSNYEKQKRTIIELFRKNRELSKRLRNISKKNKETTKEICQLYIRVDELTEERKKVWDESVKMHKLNLGDSSAFLNFDETDPFNESNFKQKEKEYLLRGIDYAIFTKTFRIVQVAKILYNLICNSNVLWSKDKKLLEILECTSKMFDRNFDLKKRKEFMSIVDEVILRLNRIKI